MCVFVCVCYVCVVYFVCVCVCVYLCIFLCIVVKNLPANAGATGDVGSIPGLGRSLGKGNGDQLQYSCLGNPVDS